MYGDITLVVAMDRNRAIGVGSRIPWRLPAEQQYFKNRTVGKIVVMGRKTYESLPTSVRPLPWRTNVILTKDSDLKTKGCSVVNNHMTILERSARGQKNMIIGGEEIYKLFFPYAARLLVTIVDTKIVGADKFFPEINPEEWREVLLRSHTADDKNPLSFAFLEYFRKRTRRA